MGSIKAYAYALGGLLVGMIVLMFILNQGKKLPVVGKVLGGAQELATEGHL